MKYSSEQEVVEELVHPSPSKFVCDFPSGTDVVNFVSSLKHQLRYVLLLILVK